MNGTKHYGGADKIITKQKGNIMTTDVFAQLMANLCTAPFKSLVLQVPTLFADNDERACQVINMIAHANNMAAICNSDRGRDMIYVVAAKLLDVSTRAISKQQVDVARVIILNVAHACNMGHTVEEVAGKMLDVVQPLVDQPLPTDWERLKRDETAINAAIRNLAFDAITERQIKSASKRPAASMAHNGV